VGFFIGLNIIMNPKQEDWIYESPDRGETMFRRKFGDKHFQREEITPNKPTTIYNDFMWIYREDWDDLANKHPAVKEYLDKLITIIKLVDE